MMGIIVYYCSQLLYGMFTRNSSEIKSELDPILDEVIQIIFQDKTASCTHEKSSVYSQWAIQAVISLNFSKKDLVLTLGNTPKLRSVKHQNLLPAKVIGYLSQKPLKTKPQQDSFFSVIICIQREGPDGLQQLLLLSASQSSCESVTPKSSFTNRITETYYLWIPNLELLMLPSLLS